MYSETWPTWGIVLDGCVMELPTLAHRTKEKEYLSWRTPQAHNGAQGPKSKEFYERCLQTNESMITLTDQAVNSARNWPTPTGSDHKGCGPTVIRKDGKNRENDRLDYAVAGAAKQFATPQARDYRSGQKSRWENPDRSRNLNDQIGGQLNADWVEILMGYDIGWTDINCDEPQEWPGWPAPLGANGMWGTPRSCELKGAGNGKTVEKWAKQGYLDGQTKFFTETGQYAYEPPRVITGQKNRAKRLKCLGNSVVPQQAYPIFKAIMDGECEFRE